MSTTDKPVRVRFAPSPTGYLHMGNIRSALFNYVFARKHQGTFILRIEDTDQKRHVPDSDRDIREVLSWMGLHWNEGPGVGGDYGPYFQTGRLDSYREHAQMLLDRGLAYYDFQLSGEGRDTHSIQWESPDVNLDPTEAKKRVEAGEAHCIRMKIDTTKYQDRFVEFDDIVRGRIKKDVEDFVIVKSDGIPTYHFAVVIDDHLMKISHIIRGIGHLDNTAKHAVLYDAFGWDKPQWAHHSNTAGLSKRKGSPSVGDYMRAGYLPESIANACMIMGWFPKDGQEVFRMGDRVSEFALEDLVNSNVGKFDEDKFKFLCKKHMEAVDSGRLLNLARPFLESTGFIAAGEGRVPDSPERERLLKIMDQLKGRMEYAGQVVDFLDFYRSGALTHNDDAIEALKNDDAQLAVKVTLELFKERCTSSSDFDASVFKALTKEASKSPTLKEKKIKGRGYFHPLRAAMTGTLQGPDLAGLSEIIGLDETIRRLEQASSL